MQLQYNAVIRLESGEVRGYHKQTVRSKPRRFVETMKVRLSGTTPLINPTQSYIDKVRDLLDEIQVTQVGQNLINDLVNAGKNIVITMPRISIAMQCRARGTSPNMARSGGDNFIEPLPNMGNAPAILNQAYVNAGAAGFAANQLSQTINAATLQLGDNQLVTANEVTGWCTGTLALPDEGSVEFRLLLYTLERWLPAGAGTGTRIEFDPWNKLTGITRRPTKVGLFHELVHAYANSTGRQIFSDDQAANEWITIGMPPFDVIANNGGARPYTENSFRPPLGLPNRTWL